MPENGRTHAAHGEDPGGRYPSLDSRRRCITDAGRRPDRREEPLCARGRWRCAGIRSHSGGCVEPCSTLQLTCYRQSGVRAEVPQTPWAEARDARRSWMAEGGRGPTTGRTVLPKAGLDLPVALPARALWLALALVLAILFITDMRAPLGALDSIPYVLAVVVSLALPRGYEPVVVAACCTAITLIGVFFAPQQEGVRVPSFLHTGLPIFVVWATEWLAQRYRQAGQAMRAADERIQLAAHAAGFGTFDYDPISGINHWSPGASRIVGLESEETITFAKLATVIHQEDVDRVLEAMRAAEDPRGQGQFEDEHRIVRPDGSVRWVLVKSRTVFDGEGAQRQAIHVSGVVMDVTERRRAEE